jgi:hypothetical protein
MAKVYKTARGRSLDMASLISKHEKTRAVSNVNSVNARGDEIDAYGKIVVPATEKVSDSYATQVGSQTAQVRADYPDISPSANPNAPLSPKQLREIDALNSKQIPEKEVVQQVEETTTPLLDKLVEEVNPPVTEEVYVAPIEQEIAPFPIVEPEEFVMKSADEAPDSFGAEGELHPEEAELAELEEDFDIEAIKKAALDNIISEPTPQSTAIESKKKGKK